MKMETLNSEKLNKLPFTLDTFKRVADLVHIEEPFLVVFQHKGNNHYYLFDWVDGNEDYNRWLVYTSSLEDLSNYMQRNLSQNELFWKGGTACHVIEIDRNFAWHNPQIIYKENLPTTYYPPQNTFFDEDYSRIPDGWLPKPKRKNKNMIVPSFA